MLGHLPFILGEMPFVIGDVPYYKRQIAFMKRDLPFVFRKVSFNYMMFPLIEREFNSLDDDLIRLILILNNESK